MSFNFSPKIVTNGLVLYLDAANTRSYVSGSTIWNDLTINGNNGTLTNGPTYNSGNQGSILFDGIDDKIVTNTSIDDTLSKCTFSAWINTQQISSLVGIYNNYAGASGFGLQINAIQQGDVYFIYTYLNGGNYIGRITGINEISINTWYQITGTWDGTFSPNGFSIYVNGVRKDTTNVNGGTVSAYAQSSFAMRIGNTYYSSAERGYFSGKIAHAQIYNRALSANEVLQNYNALKSRFGL